MASFAGHLSSTSARSYGAAGAGVGRARHRCHEADGHERRVHAPHRYSATLVQGRPCPAADPGPGRAFRAPAWICGAGTPDARRIRRPPAPRWPWNDHAGGTPVATPRCGQPPIACVVSTVRVHPAGQTPTRCVFGHKHLAEHAWPRLLAADVDHRAVVLRVEERALTGGHADAVERDGHERWLHAPHRYSATLVVRAASPDRGLADDPRRGLAYPCDKRAVPSARARRDLRTMARGHGQVTRA